MNKSEPHIFWLEQKLQKMIGDQLGPEPATIKRYRTNFEKDFQQLITKLKPVDKDFNFKNQKIVLFGDFHSSASCQQDFTEFVQVNAKAEQQTGIGLECFATSQQKWLNAYLVGAISIAELFKKSNFHNNWGFPWPPVCRLLKICKEKRLRVIALSPPWSQRKTLKERDSFFASTIIKYLSEHPNGQVFALIGELHLAPSHLPSKIQNINSCIFLQKWPENTQTKYSTSLFKTTLHNNTYLTRNAPGWTRWLSYLIWQEFVHAYPSSTIEKLHLGLPSGSGIEEPHHLFEDVLEDITCRENNPTLESRFSKIIQWLHKFYPEPSRKSQKCIISTLDPTCAIWIQQNGRAISCDMLNWRSLPLILAYLESTDKSFKTQAFINAEKKWTSKLALEIQYAAA